MNRKAANGGGFTLIEVLVALAVVTIGFGALWKGLSQEIIVSRELPDRIVARWMLHFFK